MAAAKIPHFTSNTGEKLFSQGFLSEFTINFEVLPFKEKELKDLDAQIAAYEKSNLTSDIEQSLITKNELLASFAISKAENSQLSLEEAKRIYKEVAGNSKYDFLAGKLKTKTDLTQHDHDKLEFLNILQTFREINSKSFSLTDLNETYLLRLHTRLTQCLDIFQMYLSKFDLYHPGKFRASNDIMVGNYLPPDYHEINAGLEQLIKFIKERLQINKIAIFHTALYALHPFTNGNKRVSRILEHILFRAAGLNQKNLYSTSYYYHQEKERYYKNLLLSLQRKNLNYFVSFIQEALFFSLISIVKTSIEAQRVEFLANKSLGARLNQICAPLVKQKTMQYKTLFKIARAKLKLAEQTFVNDLKKAVEEKIISKKEDGKKVYYSLRLNLPEEKWYQELINFAKTRLNYIPPRFSQAV